MGMPRSFTVVIPAHNGAGLLAEHLPGAVRAIRSCGGGNSVIVVDDASSDGTAELVKGMKMGVRVIRTGRRAGFGEACNTGMRAAKDRIVILLNNDVEVSPDFAGPLLEAFARADTFAVVARSLLPGAGMKNESVTRGTLEGGVFSVVRPGLEGDDVTPGTCTNLYASGGFSAFDRDRFLELGGFDPLYAPFYWEDVDICYAAWKRGWRTLYEPRSVVYHHSRGTIGRSYSARYAELIDLRNRYLFTWKNIADEGFIAAHARVLLRAVRSDWSGVPPLKRQSFYEAFRKIRKAASRRKAVLAETSLSDDEVLDVSANVACS